MVLVLPWEMAMALLVHLQGKLFFNLALCHTHRYLANTLFLFHQSQMVYRPWTRAIQNIADCVYNHVKSNLGGEPGIDLSHPFNSMTLLSFRGKQMVPPHTDNLYDSEGNFLTHKNSEKEGTGTFILVIGDPRIINFQLRTKKGKVVHEFAKQSYILKHGALFVLNPMCEVPDIRAFFDELEMTYWEHGQKKPSLLDQDNGMSFGMAFRHCIVPRQVDVETGSLVLTEIEKQWDEDGYHRNKELIEEFFSDEKLLRSMEEDIQKSFDAVYERHRYK